MSIIASSPLVRGGATMRDMRRGRAGKRGVRLLKWVERLLVIGGALALIWCLFVLNDADVAQRVGREVFESTPRETEPPSISGPPLPATPETPVKPATGTPLAELSIPRIGLS